MQLTTASEPSLPAQGPADISTSTCKQHIYVPWAVLRNPGVTGLLHLINRRFRSKLAADVGDMLIPCVAGRL